MGNLNIREETIKRWLRTKIKERAFKEGDFVLQSGIKSKYFVNMKSLLHDQGFLYLLTSLIKDYICELKFHHNVDIHAVGGPGYGGLHMAAGTLVRLLEIDDDEINQIYSFAIREKQKDHGMEQSYDGQIRKGDCVLIVDDVVTTGQNIRKSLDFCINNGLKPLAVFTVVNRENVNLQTMSDSVCFTKQLFTLGDLV